MRTVKKLFIIITRSYNEICFRIQIIKKELINDEEDVDWVQTEKNVFETASNYPFLVGLHSCFQVSANGSSSQQLLHASLARLLTKRGA